MFLSRRPFNSIIQELSQKLEDEEEELVTSSRRKAKERTDPNSTCVVCGDRASGCHYKCWTCEGCKVIVNIQIVYLICLVTNFSR